MKIHFCDLCNESVPQADLDEGRAFVREWRVVCATGVRSMSHAAVAVPASESAHAPREPASSADLAPSTSSSAAATSTAAPAMSAVAPAPVLSAVSIAPIPPEPRSPRRTSSAALWIGVLAMAFTAGAIVVLHDQIDELARENRDARKAEMRALTEIADARRAHDALTTTLRGESARLEKRLDDEHATIEAALARVRDEQQKRAEDLQVAIQALNAWRGETGTQSQDDRRKIAELTQRLSKSEEDALQLAERLQSLEHAAKAAPAPVVQAAPTKGEPSWKALVIDLTSKNSGVRWEAVDGIGQAHDPSAASALIPMLKDPDVFVRMATARVLGDLKAMSAVAALIDALEDPEDAVREAAYLALRAITGNKDLKFDPLAPEAERAKRLKAVREWWKKEEESGAARG
jgi:hypothetical protein